MSVPQQRQAICFSVSTWKFPVQFTQVTCSKPWTRHLDLACLVRGRIQGIAKCRDMVILTALLLLLLLLLVPKDHVFCGSTDVCQWLTTSLSFMFKISLRSVKVRAAERCYIPSVYNEGQLLRAVK